MLVYNTSIEFKADYKAVESQVQLIHRYTGNIKW